MRLLVTFIVFCIYFLCFIPNTVVAAEDSLKIEQTYASLDELTESAWSAPELSPFNYEITNLKNSRQQTQTEYNQASASKPNYIYLSCQIIAKIDSSTYEIARPYEQNAILVSEDLSFTRGNWNLYVRPAPPRVIKTRDGWEESLPVFVHLRKSEVDLLNNINNLENKLRSIDNKIMFLHNKKVDVLGPIVVGKDFKEFNKVWRFGQIETSWNESQKWIKNLGSKWRRPTILELEKLYQKYPSGSAFRCDYVWAESFNAEGAYALSFDTGKKTINHKDYAMHSRALAVLDP